MSSSRLRKCTGCGEYWYCGAACQKKQWEAHHRRVCKRIARYNASVAVQALAEHDRLDALLLSHVVAQLDDETSASEAERIMALLPGPIENPPSLPLVYTPSSTAARISPVALYARFGNNNFVLHSHLTTFAHGVFPQASRYFNHSCMPNAAAKYALRTGERPRMEVVALRDVAEGEEICLPYLDPALLQSKKEIFKYSYGFECRCPSCLFFDKAGKVTEPRSEEDNELAKKVLRFYESGPCDGLALVKLNHPPPADVLPAFHESFIMRLSQTFRDASHDGLYAKALDSGASLLALYRLIYPPNYPQIGMHLLELAKTSWNSIVAGEVDRETEERRKTLCRGYLDEATRILGILGPEGDKDGPLVEMSTLHQILRTDNSSIVGR
ncbi:hypothetical protein MKEN_00906200 [Mycena kentingensis (nom. inval.)]|nr:hypothetical protein MKEN_00906200 [Mycena kentingensis (nom. inval.)]